MPDTVRYRLAAGVGMRLIVLAAALRAQSPSAQDGDVVLHTDTRVVEVDVSVRDAKGMPVEDLNKSDFTITDNRKPRAFTIFSVNPRTPAPADEASGTPPAQPAEQLPPNTFTNIGLSARPPDGHSTIILLDVINGWFDNFALARAGVIGMMTRIPVDERLALYAITKSRGLVILQDYTLDRSRLLDAMEKYIPEGMCPAPAGTEAGDEGMRNGESPPGNHAITKLAACRNPGSMQMGVDTVRFSLKALAEGLRTQPGRKSVFWVTQGFPPSLLRGDAFWDETVSALNDANIAVNAVDSNGLGGPTRFWGPGGTLTMMQLAERTGGKAYYHRNDLDAALAEGIADSRGSYALGFYLTDVDGTYHDLKVSVDRPNLQLRYRQGYYAADELKRDKSHKNADLSTALLNPAGSLAIGITASVNVSPRGPRGAFNLSLKLTPHSLSLRNGKAGTTGKVKEMYVALNASGKVVGEQAGTSQFNIGPENQAAFSRDGITIEQTLQLPLDAVKLSIIVQDTESGRTGVLTVPLEKVTPDKVTPSAPSAVDK